MASRFFLRTVKYLIILVVVVGISLVSKLGHSPRKSASDKSSDAENKDKKIEELYHKQQENVENGVPAKFNQNPDNIYQIVTYGVPRRSIRPDGTSFADFSPYGQDQMQRFYRCQYQNCNFTLNHEDADVVVVEAMAYDWGIYRPPLLRYEGQLWILQTWEPPSVMHKLPWNKMEKQFHLTATYQGTSDIFCPYGILEEKPANRLGTSDVAWDAIKNKDRLIGWMVSNCQGQSDRFRYVRELQKYVPIDIYGKCGNLTCERGNDTCKTLIEDHYKFYLAFENSFCLDYYTEKPFIPLKRTVPIVLGGANYSEFMPPHSYINIQDFTSAKALAEYLLMLDKNPDLYLKYYDWTYKYTATYAKPEILWPCKVCEYLNTHTITQEQLDNPKVSLQDVTNQTHACTPPDEIYKNILL